VHQPLVLRVIVDLMSERTKEDVLFAIVVLLVFQEEILNVLLVLVDKRVFIVDVLSVRYVPLNFQGQVHLTQ